MRTTNLLTIAYSSNSVKHRRGMRACRRFVGISVLFATAMCIAEPVNFQGVLQEAGSPAANGVYPVELRLWDAQAGGTLLGSGAANGDVLDGLLNANIDLSHELFVDGSPQWWSLVIDGDELQPRRQFASVPYAFNSRSLATNALGSDLTLEHLNVRSLYPAASPTIDFTFDDSDPEFDYRIFIQNQNAADMVIESRFREDQLVLKSSGRIGILTSNPQAALDVNGTLRVNVLRIDGGSDLAEPFDSIDKAEPGTVMIIDTDRPGELRIADVAYDTKVAGVVSGAGGVNAGISLGQEGVFDGDTLVAMAGRVYVKATASNGPIQPGDRLTTSDLAGHAMRVSDESRAPGSVIGKAMTPLEEGEGLVLILVNLQ